jgi:LPS-assembly protein
MRKLIVFSAATLSCFGGVNVMAEVKTYELCHLSHESKFLPVSDTLDDGPVDVKANNAQLVNQGTSVFTGDVIVTRGGQELTASRATYNRQSGEVTAQGDVQLRDSEAILTSQQAEWSLVNDHGQLSNAHYLFRQNHARGEAKLIQREGIAKTKLKGATYTTCEEGDNAWLLKSGSIDLNHETAVGTARNVTVEVAGVPVFYTPYISFPLNDERKSGFLIPSIGNTNETGFDLTTPYYWNIAPNQDATISPRFMSERGLMLRGEYRYLFEQGTVDVDAGYLASDDLKNNSDGLNPYYQESRQHFTLQHQSNFRSGWNANVDYNYVSDDDYLEDFSPSLSLASTTHLTRRLNVGYVAENWNFSGRVQGYQTLTDVSDPYRRLPQLKFSSLVPNQAFGLTYGFSAEYVDFEHDDDISGQRVDLEPSLSLPLSNAYSYFTPRVAVHHTTYSLDDSVVVNGDESPSRTLPVASIDTGLFFERGVSLFNSDYVQTLEPRAFYLYIPERNQSDIPIFDTGLRTFGMDQMFAYDRFSGNDRIGDANQLSLALTSRIIDDQTGREKLRVSFGQIQYFSNRDVSLPTSSVETQSDSDFVAEVVASIANEWTVRTELQWDNQESNTSMSTVQLRYQNENGVLLNIAHRYRKYIEDLEDGIEQVDISAQLPINNKWSVIGRWYHSIKDSQNLETIAGIQYDSCCWASRLVVRDYINDITDTDSNLAIFLQFELKGLGNFGNSTEALLERSILGYGS